ncbi:MAG: hypothetical protein WBF71_16255 [Microthrixaceae bacterium]
MQTEARRRARFGFWGFMGALLAVLLVIPACTPPPPGPVVAIDMDPAMSGGFFSLPWPNDIRRSPDGSLDLEGLPGVDLLPGEVPSTLRTMFPALVEGMGRSLHGFGVNTATYFASQLQLSPGSLPSPSATLGPRPSIVLLDLDHPGERIPVIADFQITGDRNRPNNLLTVLPYPGHPLQESTRYAVALTPGLITLSGQALAPSQLIGQLDQPWSPSTGVDAATWTALRQQRDDVRAALTAETTWQASDLVAFTVFTTQDVRGDMQAVSDAVDASPAPTLNVTYQGACTTDYRAGGTQTAALSGTLELTRWQNGTYPYYDGGGEIVIGSEGRAVPQGSFAAQFTARVPCGTMPAGGWPLLTFIDGTGGTFDLNSTTLPLTYQGYLIAEIAPLYGAGRGITLTPLMTQLGITTIQGASQFTFYNFLNPAAARSNTIQQVGENLQLLDAFRSLAIDGSSLGTTGLVTTDPDRQVIAGQSQGAQTLPMVAAMRPSISGVLSSAGSGGLYHALAHNPGNRLMLGQLTGDAQVLDELNPIVQVSQTMLEGGDGINYPNTTNYLNYAGRDDICVPFETSRHFAGATGLPVHYASAPTSAYGDIAVDPPTLGSLPVQGNVGGRTRASLELPGGHYVAYDQTGITAGYLSALASGLTPTIPADGYQFGWFSSQNCPGSRWDVPPTRFAR